MSPNRSQSQSTSPGAGAAAFTAARTVRFSDCDPAGIVFFPQYLVMLNGFVEQFFDDGLGIAYAGLIGARRIGLPTVRLELDFTAVSRHGETLRLALRVARLGRSTLELQHTFHGADAAATLRLRCRQVLVCTSLLDHRPQALPEDVRAALGSCRTEDTSEDPSEDRTR